MNMFRILQLFLLYFFQMDLLFVKDPTFLVLQHLETDVLRIETVVIVSLR